MHYQSDGTQVATRPGPNPVTGVPGYVTSGNPAIALAASDDDPDVMNQILDELCNIVTAAGIALSKTVNNQVLTAIQVMLANNPRFSRLLVFTASTTWTCPAGVYWIRVRLWGGGGGGGGSNGTNSGGSAAGGGGYAEGIFAVTPGVTYNITVGAGGTAGNNAPTSGANGGASSFSTLISASGGGQGIAGNGTVSTTAGSGGSGFGGVLTISGASGSLPTNPSPGIIRVGQGGAAFSTPANLQSDTNIAYSGAAGLFPGGGGCGGALSGNGGTGAGGLVLVEY